MKLQKGVKCADTVIGQHAKEIYSLCCISDKAFKRFYKAYMGEDLKDSEVFECRVFLIHMICKQLTNDCEVLFDADKKVEEN